MTVACNSSALQSFTNCSASSRVRPINITPSSEAARSVATSITLQPMLSGRISNGSSTEHLTRQTRRRLEIIVPHEIGKRRAEWAHLELGMPHVLTKLSLVPLPSETVLPYCVGERLPEHRRRPS